jgi:hypothetical protein
MMVDVSGLPEPLARATYRLAKAVSFSEVALIIADDTLQWDFLSVVPTILGGRVVYASAPDAVAQATSRLGTPAYLFFVLDEMPREVHSLIRDYLDAHEDGAEDAVALGLESGSSVSVEQTLVFVCGKAMYGGLAPWIRERVTPIAVS